MTLENLLETLHDLEAKIEVEGNKLKLIHYHAVLPEEVRNAIRQHKASLLTMFASRQSSPCDPGLNPAVDAIDADVAQPRHGKPMPYIGGYGNVRTVRIAVCPKCGAQHWGATPHDPSTWLCLSCNARTRRAIERCPECQSRVVVRDALGWVCVTCHWRFPY